MPVTASLEAAMDRMGLGRLVATEAFPFGLFGQNLFVDSTAGRWVFRLRALRVAVGH